MQIYTFFHKLETKSYTFFHELWAKPYTFFHELWVRGACAQIECRFGYPLCYHNRPSTRLEVWDEPRSLR